MKSEKNYQMLSHIIWKIININGEENKCPFETRTKVYQLMCMIKNNRLNFFSETKNIINEFPSQGQVLKSCYITPLSF